MKEKLGTALGMIVSTVLVVAACLVIITLVVWAIRQILAS